MTGVTLYRVSRQQCRCAALLIGVFLFCAHAATDSVSLKTEPQGPALRLAAARAAPCSTALRVYQEMASDSTVPDSLKMAVCGYRADIAFALREYETAIDYYKRAAQFEKTPGCYRYRQALAVLANGDTAASEAVFKTIADNGQAPLANEAQVALGGCLIRRGQFMEAMALFQKAGHFSPKDSWSIQALLGKLACARHLGLVDSIAAFEKQLSPYAAGILEKDRLRKIREIPLPEPAVSEAVPVKIAIKDTVIKETPKDSVFSLQVGAFGSKERAAALTKKLAAKFKEVECVAAVVDERTFYRVWVGNFDSRDEAESFGKTKLMRQGLEYRVVVK
ncbi:MAG: SPOR domain-containing protein [Chitinispirillaceae bacterium]